MRIWLLIAALLVAGTYSKKICVPTGPTAAPATEGTSGSPVTAPSGETTTGGGSDDSTGSSTSPVADTVSTVTGSDTVATTTPLGSSTAAGPVGPEEDGVNALGGSGSSSLSPATAPADDSTTTEDCEWTDEPEPSDHSTTEANPETNPTGGSTKAPVTRGGVTVSYSNFKMNCQKEPGSCVYRYDVPQQSPDQMALLATDKSKLDVQNGTAMQLQVEVNDAEANFTATDLGNITQQVADLQQKLDAANAKVQEYTVTLNYMKNETLLTTYAINQMNGYLVSIAADKNNCYYYCTQPQTTTTAAPTSPTTTTPAPACLSNTDYCLNDGKCYNQTTAVCECYGNLDGQITKDVKGCTTSVCSKTTKEIIFPEKNSDTLVHFYSPGYDSVSKGNYSQLMGCSWFLTTEDSDSDRWLVNTDVKTFSFTSADPTARMNITYVPFFLSPAQTTTSYLVTKLTPADLNNILTMADKKSNVTFALSSTQKGGYFYFDFSFQHYSSASRSKVLPVGV